MRKFYTKYKVDYLNLDVQLKLSDNESATLQEIKAWLLNKDDEVSANQSQKNISAPGINPKSKGIKKERKFSLQSLRSHA